MLELNKLDKEYDYQNKIRPQVFNYLVSWSSTNNFNIVVGTSY